MARILICHVPKDGSIARDLGAALMGRGHYVSFDGEPDTARPDRASRLRQFEAVVVIWTEGSAQNAGLSSIAAETLPLNVLVPVKAEGMEKSRLPLMFRKLNMFAPREVDGIARLVARLSTAAASLRDMAASHRDMAEREAQDRAPPPPPTEPPVARSDRAAPRASSPAQQPTPDPTLQSYLPPLFDRQPQRPVVEATEAVRARPLKALPEVADEQDHYADWHRQTTQASAETPEPPQPERPPQRSLRRPPRVLTADDLARAVDAGLILHHIPEAMWLGMPTTVELTLGHEVLAGLVQADPESVSPGDGRPSIETLSLSLYGSADAFDIERQSERTQFVGPRYAQSGRDPSTFGRWAWLVTPRAAGPGDLFVRVSALLRDHNGVPTPVALPDRRFEVEIQVPEGENLISALAGWYRP